MQGKKLILKKSCKIKLPLKPTFSPNITLVMENLTARTEYCFLKLEMYVIEIKRKHINVCGKKVLKWFEENFDSNTYSKLTFTTQTYF